MSTYASQLSRIVNRQPSVTPETIRAAAEWVADKNCSPKALEAFTDLFQAASSEGRLSQEAREAYRDTLLSLVEKAPGSSASPTGLSPTASRIRTPQLERQLKKVQQLIVGHRKEIGALETKLSDTLSRIDDKTKTIDALIARRTEYQSTLKKKLDNRRTLLLFAAFGAFGAAGTAVGLGAAMSIGDLQREISALDHQIRAAQSEKAHYQASLHLFRQQQGVMSDGLENLRQVEATLVAKISAAPSTSTDVTPLQEIAELSQHLVDTQALAANLQEQVDLLRTMHAHAGAFESGLDALIAALEKEIVTLEERTRAAERALFETVIDVVFAQSGIDPNLRIGELSFSKKRLLLDGLDYVRLSLHQQVHSLVDKMIVDGLVDATGSRQIASTLVNVLRGKAETADIGKAALRELSHRAMADLSEPQRFLVDHLLHRPTSDIQRDKLLELVLKNANIGDAQARTLAAILSSEAAPPGKKDAAFRAAVKKSNATETELALSVLRYGLDAYGSEGEGASRDDYRKPSLEGQASVAHRVRALAKPGSAVDLLLAQSLSRYEEHKGEWHDAERFLRAGLFGAMRALKMDAQGPQKAAECILRGWQKSMAAWGERPELVAEDARRAMDDAIALLPAGDPVRGFLTEKAREFDAFAGWWHDAAALAKAGVDEAVRQLARR